MDHDESKLRSLAISPPQSLLEVDEHATSSNDSILLGSASITSSVTQWEWENGRRYHGYKAGSYPIPNDEVRSKSFLKDGNIILPLCLLATILQELERIDLKHHVMMLLCDAHLHLAPLYKPQRILDIGTGTGIWAIQMADQYPETIVIGTDLSPVQPSWVPDNVRFEIDDIEAKDWTWADNSFDYIHSRFMIASISSWPRLVRKGFQHCKPGGYFELQELDPRFRCDDGTINKDSGLAYFNEVIIEAGLKYNRPLPKYDEHYAWFVKAGFVDIQQVFLKSPSNPWPKDKLLKEVGKFQLVAHLEGLEGVSMGLLCRGLQWKADEVKVLMAKLRPELRSRAIHSYQITTVIVGRKPETSQSRNMPSDASSSYGQAPLTPTSISTGFPGSSSSSAVEAPREEYQYSLPYGSSLKPSDENLNDVIPGFAVQQRSTDPNLEDFSGRPSQS